MKPEFIIIVVIIIILVWATLQASFSNFSDLDRKSSEDTTAVETRTPRVRNTARKRSNVETYGKALSPYAEKVSLRSGKAKKDEAKEEYLELRADDDNTVPIPITGWKLKSIEHNRTITIGTAALVPVYRGRPTANDTVVLQPEDRAYVISGTSPIRVSFRTNVCTGYFAENNTFKPRLPRECPDPEDENLEAFGIDSDPPERDNNKDYQCIKKLKRIGKCKNPGKPDDELSRDCRDYINQIGYRLCAGLHVRDADFAGDEWYLYVGRASKDLWDDDDDTILLLDQNNRVVDSIAY